MPSVRLDGAARAVAPFLDQRTLPAAPMGVQLPQARAVLMDMPLPSYLATVLNAFGFIPRRLRRSRPL